MSGQILGEIFVARNTPLNLAPLEITHAQSALKNRKRWSSVDTGGGPGNPVTDDTPKAVLPHSEQSI